ncbi:MAG: phosphate regulon sensor histidine kinase PhoR [Pseudomonadota bacterium]
MTHTSRKYIVGVLLCLAAGAVIGWFYGEVERGILIAALVSLIWHMRHLLAFGNALRTGDFMYFRQGDGIWQQIYSQLRYERDRGSAYKKQHRQLLKEFRRSTNAIPDGAIMLNSANEIVVSNQASKHLAGIKQRKDRGRRVDNILRDPDVSELLDTHDATVTIDIESPVKENVWLNCRVVPYGRGQKLLLLRDVTDRKLLQKMRRDFIANASHELRSPLTVISGYLDMFADDKKMPADFAQPIDSMQSQARRMAKIVDELLQLSRLESAGAASDDEVIDVVAILTDIRKQYDGQLGTPAIELDLASSASLLGNAHEFESIVGNLVSNALRHTPATGTVSITWQSDSDGARLSVSDTGEGIASEHIPRLTERFFRVDRGRARQDGGIGLGLAIVKYALERHQAELLIESEPDVGSTFTCVFPATRVSIEPPVSLISES